MTLIFLYAIQYYCACSELLFVAKAEFYCYDTTIYSILPVENIVVCRHYFVARVIKYIVMHAIDTIDLY